MNTGDIAGKLAQGVGAVRAANEQIRRLRAGLIEARDTLRDHFGPEDASVRACEVALWPVDAKGYTTVRIDEIEHLPPSRINFGAPL